MASYIIHAILALKLKDHARGILSAIHLYIKGSYFSQLSLIACLKYKSKVKSAVISSL